VAAALEILALQLPAEADSKQTHGVVASAPVALTKSVHARRIEGRNPIEDDEGREMVTS